MFNSYVARVLTRTCCFYISYWINHTQLHTVIGVSYSHWGFLWGFKKIWKSIGPMKQLTIQSLGFLIAFQEDIKIMMIITIIIIIIIIIVIIIIVIIIVIVILIVIIIVILACPDARCESGQTSGSCPNIILYTFDKNILYYIILNDIVLYYIMVFYVLL